MTPQMNIYYNRIAEQKKLGAKNEQNLRPIFYELLKNYTDAEGLTIQYEQRERTDLFDNYPDGRILRQNIPMGHIENKDAADDLDKEIDKKLNGREYPKYNILFENTERLVLYQAGKKVEDISMYDAKELNKVLLRFVQYQTAEQLEFIKALNTLKGLVPDLAQELREFLLSQKDQNDQFKSSLDEFLQESHKSINKYLTYDDAIGIIIQHLLTEDIFIIFFSDAEFHKQNAIAKQIENIMGTLSHKKREIHSKIDDYIVILKKYIHQMGKEDKKDVLKIFYEDFYTALNSKKADVQGVVYTPLAIVRFMIEAADHFLYKYFDKTLASNGVKILDPCTGTGIFMSELLAFLPQNNLEYKYDNELFANEIDVLPYYIANLNIEYAYHEKMNNYKSFENICLIDALEFQKAGGRLFGIQHFSGENLERAVRQYDQDISVVIGNPPYNANQKSENHNNKNKVYQEVDRRIKETYVKESTAQKTKQFDMYKRFIRWASDRINDNGMIAFITNNAYLDAAQDDGFRKCVQREFDYIYIVDLKGNARKNNKKEGQNVFNIMVGAAIAFFIKDARIKDKKAEIFYKSVEDFAKRQEKLFMLSSSKIKTMDFERIIPSDKNQWLGQTDNDFEEHPALILKEVKNKGIGDKKALFQLFSLGVATNRDNWAYDFDPQQLARKAQKLISVYDKERAKYKGLDYQDYEMKRDLDYSIKWSKYLKLKMVGNKQIVYNRQNIRESLYRPFCKKYLYFDSSYCDQQLQNPKIFPAGAEGENLCINFDMIKPRRSEHVLVTSNMIDLGFMIEGSISVPLYVYDANGARHENITDWGLSLFRERYGEEITAQGVIQYCYAVLSSPAYQKKYADNLKTDYPRIPLYEDFEFYRSRGEKLMFLHADFERVKPYEGLEITVDNDYLPEGIGNPNKNKATHPMKLDKKNGILYLDAKNKISGIPQKVYEYKIGTKSALDWVVEYHKFKKLDPEKELHHKTLIEEDLDTYDWKSIRTHLLELIPKIITVSLDTLTIYDELDSKK